MVLFPRRPPQEDPDDPIEDSSSEDEPNGLVPSIVPCEEARIPWRDLLDVLEKTSHMLAARVEQAQLQELVDRAARWGSPGAQVYAHLIAAQRYHSRSSTTTPIGDLRPIDPCRAEAHQVDSMRPTFKPHSDSPRIDTHSLVPLAAETASNLNPIRTEAPFNLSRTSLRRIESLPSEVHSHYQTDPTRTNSVSTTTHTSISSTSLPDVEAISAVGPAKHYNPQPDLVLTETRVDTPKENLPPADIRPDPIDSTKTHSDHLGLVETGSKCEVVQLTTPQPGRNKIRKRVVQRQDTLKRRRESLEAASCLYSNVP